MEGGVWMEGGLFSVKRSHFRRSLKEETVYIERVVRGTAVRRFCFGGGGLWLWKEMCGELAERCDS